MVLGMYMYSVVHIQSGDTPYAIAEKKGHDKVCEELLPPELKRQPEVRSDSAQHKFAVSFTSDIYYVVAR